jgi:hypothetical protein
MEKAWCEADVHEVTSREGVRENASLKMFFTDFRAFTKASAAETDSRLTRMERVNKVDLLSAFLCNLVLLLSWQPSGAQASCKVAGLGSVPVLTFCLLSAVGDRQADRPVQQACG